MPLLCIAILPIKPVHPDIGTEFLSLCKCNANAMKQSPSQN